LKLTKNKNHQHIWVILKKIAFSNALHLKKLDIRPKIDLQKKLSSKISCKLIAWNNKTQKSVNIFFEFYREDISSKNKMPGAIL